MAKENNKARRFDLRYQLDPPHAGDVKAVLAISDAVIASASRDQSVGIWHKTANDGVSLFQPNMTSTDTGHYSMS
jgi:WD40 repeat protein